MLLMIEFSWKVTVAFDGVGLQAKAPWKKPSGENLLEISPGDKGVRCRLAFHTHLPMNADFK